MLTLPPNIANMRKIAFSFTMLMYSHLLTLFCMHTFVHVYLHIYHYYEAVLILNNYVRLSWKVMFYVRVQMDHLAGTLFTQGQCLIHRMMNNTHVHPHLPHQPRLCYQCDSLYPLALVDHQTTCRHIDYSAGSIHFPQDAKCRNEV